MRKLVALSLLALLYIAVVVIHDARYPGFDPDQWYHKAFSRSWQEAGFPAHVVRTLPQAEDIGWGRQFYEKEFFFHALTTAGYALAGDRGVEWAAHLAAFGILALVFLALMARFGILRALAVVVLLMLVNPAFSYRLTLVRPHVVAIFFFTGLAMALWRGSALLSLVTAAGFVLSYHAAYLPVILLAGGILLEKLRGKTWRAPLSGCCGLVIGLMANPYFPTNLVMGYLHLRFIFEPPLPEAMAAGSELLSYSPKLYLLHFYPYLILLSFYGWVILGKRRNFTPEALALATAGIFWLMTVKIQRAAEYAVPISLLAVAVCQRDLFARRQEPFRKSVVALWLAAALGPLALFFLECRREPDRFYQIITTSVWEALKQPEPGDKVLNCDWGVGSLIYYARPDLRFVDLLDPRFLRQWNPKLFFQLAALKSGHVEDPHEIVTRDFRAQWVLCGSEPLNEQLMKDPRFQEVYRAEHSSIRLFASER